MRTKRIVWLFALLLIAGCISKGTYNQKVQQYNQEAQRVNVMSDQLRACVEQNRKFQAEAQANQEKNEQFQAEAKAAREQNERLQAEAQAEREKNEELQAEIKAIQEESKRMEAEVKASGKEIKKQEGRVQQPETPSQQAHTLSPQDKTYQELTRRLEGEIQVNQVEVKQRKDRMAVSMMNLILFPEGGWEVHEKGKAILDRMIPVFKDLKEKRIEVQGFTDNVLIGPALRKRFPTNWELSAARASDVVRYLQQKGIDPKLLKACGFSEYQPVASNDTPEGRARNRRVEIVIVPADQ